MVVHGYYLIGLLSVGSVGYPRDVARDGWWTMTKLTTNTVQTTILETLTAVGGRWEMARRQVSGPPAVVSFSGGRTGLDASEMPVMDMHSR